MFRTPLINQSIRLYPLSQAVYENLYSNFSLIR